MSEGSEVNLEIRVMPLGELDEVRHWPLVMTRILQLSKARGLYQPWDEYHEPWACRVSPEWGVAINCTDSPRDMRPDGASEFALVDPWHIYIWFGKQRIGWVSANGGSLMINGRLEGEEHHESVEEWLLNTLALAIAGASVKQETSEPEPEAKPAASEGSKRKWRVQGIRMPLVEEMEIVVEAASVAEAEELVLREDGPYEAEIQRIIALEPSMDWAPTRICPVDEVTS